MNVLGSSGTLLSRRDWVYSLSLLVPFIVYNLALKADSVVAQPGDVELVQILGLMRSDAFFDLGYALFWIGLFAAVRGGPLHRTVVVLFHAATILVAIVTTCALQYYRQTGTTLDYEIIALWVPNFGEVLPILVHGVPLLAWMVLAAALFYAALGPLLVTYAVERWWMRPGRSLSTRPGNAVLGSLGLWLLALGFVFLSLLIGTNPAGASKSFARDPFVNVVVTGVEEATAGADEGETGPVVEHPAAHATLAQTSRTEKRNVVLIHLESTRARSVTPYNENLGTTPFLDELAKNSLLAERAYTTVTHTSKASVSANCGIFPHLVAPTTEALPGGIPAPCLADLLKKEGYNTVFFQSSTKSFENFPGLVRNFGYEEYYPLESMDPEGFEKSNYFGYEDDIMLEPSEEWLKENGDEPFVAEYLMGTGHHDYQCLDTRYGSEDFAEDELLNHYLNCLRLQDIFLKQLFDQYEELGLYENTIFVLFGDHGEAFGEHGRYQHNDVPYEEGLKVPLIIHAPGWFEDGERVEGLSNLNDILPTVVGMLGYEVEGGEYPGYSLLRLLPEGRTLRFSCWFDDQCLTSIEGVEKYIHHYGNQSDELFDLSRDPFERENLANERAREVDERREDLLKWRSEVNAAYHRP